MDTISKLQAELEELEKRLKAISNAQSTLSHLIAIRDYFDKVQEYLEIIKDEYSSGSNSCTVCNEKIADLQEQINTINDTLKNPPNSEIDFSEIQSQINNISSELENLKNGSDANLMDLSTDISTIQTEIGYIEDQLEEKSSEISAINTQMGDMQNTITNLSATQNSMTSAHTSMNNSINSLTTRLINAENNIATLTGGVDVSEIDKRISVLEEENYGDHYVYKDLKYNFTPLDNILYTREYYFSLEKGKSAKEIITLNYQSAGEGTFTVDLYKNKEIVKTIEIDLSKYPSTFSFNYKYVASLFAQATRIKIASTTEFTFNSLELEIFGKDVRFYRYDRDVKVACYNNQIYITRYQDGVFKFGKFGAEETIDIDNLPNQEPTSDERCGGYTNFQYVPIMSLDDNPRPVVEKLYYEGINNYNYEDLYFTESTKPINQTIKQSPVASGWLLYSASAAVYMQSIKNGYPAIHAPSSTYIYTYDKQTSVAPDWLYIIPVLYNYFDDKTTGNSLGSGYVSYEVRPIVALNNDGYFYYIPSYRNTNAYKMAKGLDGTCYKQSDDKHTNYYIFDGKKVTRYRCKYVDHSSLTVTAVFEDCDCVYETYNNKIIKHTISTDTWSVEDCEYLPETT